MKCKRCDDRDFVDADEKIDHLRYEIEVLRDEVVQLKFSLLKERGLLPR